MNHRRNTLRNNAMRSQRATAAINGAAHRVLRNSDLLLPLTLGIVAAGVSAALHLPQTGVIIPALGYANKH